MYLSGALKRKYTRSTPQGSIKFNAQKGRTVIETAIFCFHKDIQHNHTVVLK